MSVAYFIVLDTEDPSFDPFVDGKMLAKHQAAINDLARKLGLREFEDFLSQDLSEFDVKDMADLWFDPDDGITWAETLIQHLNKKPDMIDDQIAVIEDLSDYLKVFREAKSRGQKWHLELDF